MQSMEDGALAPVAARVAGDDLAPAADDDLPDAAPRPVLLMAAGHRHRVIVAVPAHRRLATELPVGLTAGL